MGNINKTITLQVPVNVVYDVMKSMLLSGDEEKYFSDFKIVSTRFRLKSRITKDIPNAELEYGDNSWGSEVRWSLSFRPTGESWTQVTLKMNYKKVPEFSAQQSYMCTFGYLQMLEAGYNAKR